MIVSKTIIKNNMQSGMSPAEAFAAANRQLCEQNDANMFVTAWMCMFEISTGKTIYVNAGHNPPVVQQNGEYRYMKNKSGFILAGMDMTMYKEYEFVLDDGDALYLYTDGVTESENIAHEIFGEERLLKTLADGGGLTVKSMVNRLAGSVQYEYVNGRNSLIIRKNI
ncbi:MAG: serine/threonine-protein phosphatase [Clostridiales bacterium]|nr:serine/threonine-protein phosphatase [Clostridiales bacterium]